MIIRTMQALIKDFPHQFSTEVYNHLPKSWIAIDKCHYHYKDAKVRISDGVVFLVGHSIDTEDELIQLSVDFLGELIDWNDDEKKYKYIEWVNFYEAYY